MNAPNAAPNSEDPSSPGLVHYWGMIVRGRRWLALPIVACWAISLLFAMVASPRYKSETVILIEQQKVPAQYITPNVSVDLQQRLQSLTQQILSRTRLVRIMDEFHLYGKQPGQEASEASVQLMRSAITIDLIKSGGRTDDLSAFKISYWANTPTLAQAVAGKLTSLFIDENLSNQRQAAENTTSFLDSQLTEARKDLEDQEQVLRGFRSRYMGELPEQLPSNVQILAGLQARLQSTTDALNQAEQQRLYFTSLAGQSIPASRVALQASTPNLPEAAATLDQQLEQKRSELATLSIRYTPQHPDVIRLSEQISRLEGLKKQALPESRPAKQGAAPERIASPQSALLPLGQLDGQLKANELEIANRKREVKGLEAQIEEYQTRLNLTPMREQQLASVARNHEQSRTNYESLLAKKMQSEMATNLEKRQQGEQFKIIDPPSLSQRPYWPNPLQFSAIGLMAGAVMGFAIVFVQDKLNAQIHSEADLREWADIPIIASIPPLPTASELSAESRNRRREIFAGSVIALLIPIVTLAAYMKQR